MLFRYWPIERRVTLGGAGQFAGDRYFSDITHQRGIMKLLIQSLIMGAGLLTAGFGYAQSQPAKSGAPAPTTASAPASATVLARPKAPTGKGVGKAAQKAPSEAAPGGGDGKVWVNSGSKTYHCPGTQYYGKTKAGEYMSESDAKAKGNHANHKKACA